MVANRRTERLRLVRNDEPVTKTETKIKRFTFSIVRLVLYILLFLLVVGTILGTIFNVHVSTSRLIIPTPNIQIGQRVVVSRDDKEKSYFVVERIPFVKMTGEVGEVVAGPFGNIVNEDNGTQTVYGANNETASNLILAPRKSKQLNNEYVIKLTPSAVCDKTDKTPRYVIRKKNDLMGGYNSAKGRRSGFLNYTKSDIEKVTTLTCAGRK